MFLTESRSKALLSGYGVKIPAGRIANSETEAVAVARELGCDRFAIKAQILAGGRGLAGGVSFANSSQTTGIETRKILGTRLVTEQTGPEGEIVETVYVEEAVSVRSSLYFAIVIDQKTALPALLGSSEGGVEFEEKAARQPDILVSCLLEPDCSGDSVEIAEFLARMGIPEHHRDSALDLVNGCIKAFADLEINILEVNPMAITDDGDVMAVDAKISLDDNALFRHPEYEALSPELQPDPVEQTARENEINFVRLDGDIGVVTNGAGLGLATNDMLIDAGGRPANFMDIRTTATSQQIAKGVTLLLEDRSVKAMLLNVHGGGMTVCDTVVEGLALAFSRSDRRLPIVARLAGQKRSMGTNNPERQASAARTLRLHDFGRRTCRVTLIGKDIIHGNTCRPEHEGHCSGNHRTVGNFLHGPRPAIRFHICRRSQTRKGRHKKKSVCPFSIPWRKPWQRRVPRRV